MFNRNSKTPIFTQFDHFYPHDVSDVSKVNHIQILHVNINWLMQQTCQNQIAQYMKHLNPSYSICSP